VDQPPNGLPPNGEGSVDQPPNGLPPNGEGSVDQPPNGPGADVPAERNGQYRSSAGKRGKMP